MYRSIIISFVFVVGFGFLRPAFAQEPEFGRVVEYAAPDEYTLAGITVSGVKYLDEDVLISISGLEIGQKVTIPGDEITGVIKKFYEQGLFSDVKVSVTKFEGTNVFLDIYLQERPRLSKLEISGVSKSDKEDILEKISLRNGSQITDNLLSNTEKIIRDYYIEKGFYNTDVEMVMKDDTTYANRVSLNIQIDKNDKVKIEEIYITGNEAFPDKRLRRVMKNTKKRNLNFFKPSKYIKSDFKEDKESLITFYNEHGYRDAAILTDSIERVNEKRINLYMHLLEGDQYYFGDVTWVGNTKYPSEILNSVLGINKGDIYDQQLLDNRLQIEEDAVSSLYLDNGYLFFQVTPVEKNIENDTIDLEMRVYEGKQARIDEIIITGNTKTNEHVVRREIRTKPGELFSKSDIIRTVRELANLGHFDPEKIEPNPIPNQADGTVDLEYKLVERANDQLEVSGGWGAGMLVGTIGLRFSNFSASRIFDPKAWRPVPSGDGQTLSVRAQSNGKLYQSYNMTFVEPWFGGKKPNSFSVSLFYSKINRAERGGSFGQIFQPSDEYMIARGASVGLGRRLRWPDDFFTLYHELSYQNYKLNEYYSSFPFNNGTSHNLSFRTTLARNSVDQLIYPRRGSSFTLGLQLTPPYSLFQNKDFASMGPDKRYEFIEYHKWTFKADWYLKLIGNLVLATKSHFGFLGHYNNELGPSPFEGYDVGGDGMTGYNLVGRETIALRGYENSSLTPVVDGSRWGNIYNKYTLEMRYPISLNPQATVFALGFLEAGNAWYDFESFNPFLVKRSAGVGLRAFLPMFGLLGIDWGYGFDRTPGAAEVSGGQFHFVIGQQF